MPTLLDLRKRYRFLFIEPSELLVGRIDAFAIGRTAFVCPRVFARLCMTRMGKWRNPMDHELARVPVCPPKPRERV